MGGYLSSYEPLSEPQTAENLGLYPHGRVDILVENNTKHTLLLTSYEDGIGSLSFSKPKSTSEKSIGKKTSEVKISIKNSKMSYRLDLNNTKSVVSTSDGYGYTAVLDRSSEQWKLTFNGRPREHIKLSNQSDTCSVTILGWDPASNLVIGPNSYNEVRNFRDVATYTGKTLNMREYVTIDNQYGSDTITRYEESGLIFECVDDLDGTVMVTVKDE